MRVVPAARGTPTTRRDAASEVHYAARRALGLDWLPMGFKTRREAKRLRAKAEADPAIRKSWLLLHDAAFVGFQMEGVGPDAHEPSMWRSIFEEFEAQAPSRQELEWWRTVCARGQSVDGWIVQLTGQYHQQMLPVLAAMIEAIDAMLPEAAVGPSSERYP